MPGWRFEWSPGARVGSSTPGTREPPVCPPFQLWTSVAPRGLGGQAAIAAVGPAAIVTRDCQACPQGHPRDRCRVSRRAERATGPGTAMTAYLPAGRWASGPPLNSAIAYDTA
jgi:hypothetical protein